MLITCWSVKGGVGTTTVAAVLALAAARRSEAALLVDLDGDLPGALGIPDPVGPGVAGWSRAGASVPPDALGRLAVTVGPGLQLLPRGDGELEPARAGVLGALLAMDSRTVVVDAGLVGRSEAGRELAAVAHRSLLVTRACQLALARSRRSPVAPSGVVVVREPGRGLTAADVEAVVGSPVLVELAVDPAVARVIDAGLLAGRLPRRFASAMATLT